MTLRRRPFPSRTLLAGWTVPAELASAAAGLVSAVAARRRSRGRHDDRGDVPGWVLVTLMTAGLVLVLWQLARGRLTEVFNKAVNDVLNGG